ncbi:PhzF family phenazine biosynthesis protein [Herbiconiux sp. VKM Ac-2851]|nr:PhzF family phenazine biosynthesis protein [Herbiconiux sp. VKM Ac-2851]
MDAHPADPTPPDTTPEVLRLTAFAATPEGGNPAGVVLEAGGFDDAALQAIAAEVGYSETAFLVDPAIDGDERHVRARYFSPTAEVPFCGHATIATAVALAEQRGPGPFTVETPVGPIVIETTLDGDRMLAAFTSVTPDVRAPDEGVTDDLLALLGLTPADLDPRFPLLESFAGNWHPVVAVASAATFDAFTFDPAALRALMDRRGWRGTVTVMHAPAARAADPHASAPAPAPDPAPAPAPAAPAPAPAAPAELEVETRNLFPVGAITEDPATGSAAASLGGYLRHLGALTPPARLTIHQGRHVGRPSLLVATIPPTGGIRVEGTATPIP